MAKILVVDDDPDVQVACRLILEKEGHTVACAPNRAEGMATVESFQPDLLILDVMMNQLDDGIIMAQDLRRKEYSTPILMLTSIGKVSGMTFGRDNEANPVDDLVEKPVQAADLLARINVLLSSVKE